MTMEFLNEKRAMEVIDLIRKAGKKMDERIHVVGCSGLKEYLESGNLDILSNLAKAMPKSARGNSLKFWITRHANVRWKDSANKGTGGFVKAKKGDEREVNLSEAIENPFYEKADTEKKEFIPENRVKSFLNSFTKALREGDITPEQWKEVQDKIANAQIMQA